MGTWRRPPGLRLVPLLLAVLLLLWVQPGHGAGGGEDEGSYPKCEKKASDKDLHEGEEGPQHYEERRLAGSKTWWCEVWELSTVTAVFAAIMVTVAMIFEQVFDFLHHRADKSYVYGETLLEEDEKEANASTHLYGEPLMQALIHRMGSEFMVLGFLALIVWLTNQFGLFDLLAEQRLQHMHTPTQGVDYLHLAERVHIQLFLSMALYYLLCFRVCQGSANQIYSYEDLRGQWVQQLKEQTANNLELDSPSLRRFKMMRRHFIEFGAPMMLDWRETNAVGFGVICANMGIEDGANLTLDQMKDHFEGCFSFAPYMAFSIRQVVEEFIHLKIPTLCCIVFSKILIALYGWYSQAQTEQVHFVFMFTAVALVVILVLFISRNQRSIDQGRIPKLGCCSARLDLENFVLHSLQAMLFFFCFGLVQNAFDLVLLLWSSTAEESLMLLLDIEVVIDFIFLGFFYWTLYHSIPHFAALAALPPFLNTKDQTLILQVVRNFGATGHLWAPVVTENNLNMVVAHGREGVRDAVNDVVTELALDGVQGVHLTFGPKTIAEVDALEVWLYDLLASTDTEQSKADGSVTQRAASNMSIMRKSLRRTITLKNIARRKSVATAGSGGASLLRIGGSGEVES